MNKSYFVSGRLLITLLTLAALNNAAAVNVSFDDSSPLSMFDEVQYNLADNEIDFYINDPIICHTSTDLIVSGLAAIVTDANGNGGNAMPITDSVQYNVSNQLIQAGVNATDAACATKNSGSFNDIIFSTGFEQGVAFTIDYINVPDLVVVGQPIDYAIMVQNNSTQELAFDLLEFVSEESLQNTAYFSDTTVSWDCANENLPNVDCGENIISRYGVRDVILQAGEFAQISVSRTVSAQSVLNEGIDMLAAVFVKNQAGDFVDIETVDKEIVVVENEAPQLSWLNNSINPFVEDDQTGQVLSFRIDDGSGANFTVSYLEQVILSYNDKVEFSNVSVQQVLSGVYDVSFTVMPQADKFTDSQNSEFISIQVSDVFNVFSNTLILEVGITPVNDAPSFGVSCTHLILDPTPLAGQPDVICDPQSGTISSARSGVYTWSDFLTNVSPGPYENQTVEFEIAPGITGDPIIENLIIGSNNTDLWVAVSDTQTGSATFNLIATDNGIGGVNQFQSPTDITIELKPVSYLILGSVVDFPTNPSADVELELTVNGNVIPEIFNIGVNEINNNDFEIPFQLNDQDNYSITIVGGSFTFGCAISAGQSGTINAASANDLVIDCGP